MNTLPLAQYYHPKVLDYKPYTLLNERISQTSTVIVTWPKIAHKLIGLYKKSIFYSFYLLYTAPIY